MDQVYSVLLTCAAQLEHDRVKGRGFWLVPQGRVVAVTLQNVFSEEVTHQCPVVEG